MCKILAITNMSKVKNIPKLIGVIKREITKTDNHGFGYAVLGETGALGGERTINVAGFRAMQGDKHAPDNPVYTLPFVQRQSDVFGDLEQAMRAPKSMVCHGRMSTNTVSLDCTHPFYNKTVALIHNGVVQDESGDIDELCQTDNDSEILLRYWERGGMPDIEANVSGYYAMAILDTSGVMHIVRDDQAMLNIAWCQTIESFIIGTKAESIEVIAKTMHWKISGIEPILNNTYAIFDRNTVKEYTTISPLKSVFNYARQGLVDKALGRTSEVSITDYSGVTVIGDTDDAPVYREENMSRRDLQNIAHSDLGLTYKEITSMSTAELSAMVGATVKAEEY